MIVNSEAWNWTAFCSKYRIDFPRVQSAWFGAKPHFDINPQLPFDGKIEALRPQGIDPGLRSFGNGIYQLINACLIARAMNCAALDLPDIFGLDYLPIVVDDLRIGPAGSSKPNSTGLGGCFYWPNGFEPLVGDYSANFALDTIRRFVHPVCQTLLNAAGCLGDHVLAVHFRGGDIFRPGGTHPWYLQPPVSFYLKAIKFAQAALRVTAVHLVFQDRTNPCVDIVEEFLATHDIPFTLQSSSVFEDVVTLMSARHIVAAYGTFCESIGLLSERIRTYIGFRSLSTQRAISYWAQSRVEDVLRAKGVRMFVIDDPDVSYIKPDTWSNTPEQLGLMQAFPETKLRLLERLAYSACSPTEVALIR